MKNEKDPIYKALDLMRADRESLIARLEKAESNNHALMHVLGGLIDGVDKSILKDYLETIKA